jgi:excisionase family DNA binding protein
MSNPEWLELAEASQMLGVHPSTLRRWADAGKIEHARTLSGRRRFQRSAVERVRKSMGQPAESQQPAQFNEFTTLDLARQRTGNLTALQAGWLHNLNDEQKLLFRYSGQRLLGLMVQFISRSDGAEAFLEEGRKVAGDYGWICYKAGLSITQTAEAFLYFRRSMVESVQATTGLGGPNDVDGPRIFLRTIDFFDSLLVATIESYAKFITA